MPPDSVLSCHRSSRKGGAKRSGRALENCLRRAAKTDANHQAIVAALKKIGAKVVDLSAVGNGVPDLCVGLANRWVMVEIKDGAKCPSARKLTPDQIKWHQEHAGLPVFVVLNEEEAIAALTKP